MIKGNGQLNNANIQQDKQFNPPVPVRQSKNGSEGPSQVTSGGNFTLTVKDPVVNGNPLLSSSEYQEKQENQENQEKQLSEKEKENLLLELKQKFKDVQTYLPEKISNIKNNQKHIEQSIQHLRGLNEKLQKIRDLDIKITGDDYNNYKGQLARIETNIYNFYEFIKEEEEQNKNQGNIISRLINGDKKNQDNIQMLTDLYNEHYVLSAYFLDIEELLNNGINNNLQILSTHIQLHFNITTLFDTKISAQIYEKSFWMYYNKLISIIEQQLGTLVISDDQQFIAIYAEIKNLYGIQSINLDHKLKKALLLQQIENNGDQYILTNILTDLLIELKQGNNVGSGDQFIKDQNELIGILLKKNQPIKSNEKKNNISYFTNAILNINIENLQLFLSKNLLNDENKYEAILTILQKTDDLTKIEEKLLEIFDSIKDITALHQKKFIIDTKQDVKMVDFEDIKPENKDQKTFMQMLIESLEKPKNNTENKEVIKKIINKSLEKGYSISTDDGLEKYFLNQNFKLLLEDNFFLKYIEKIEVIDALTLLLNGYKRGIISSYPKINLNPEEKGTFDKILQELLSKEDDNVNQNDQIDKYNDLNKILDPLSLKDIILNVSIENIELLLKKNLISDENKYKVILELTENLGELPERNDKLLKILDYITDEHIQKRHKESFGSINQLINNLGRNGSFGSLLQQPLFLKYIEKLKVNDALFLVLNNYILFRQQNNLDEKAKEAFNKILQDLLNKENINHEEVGKLLDKKTLVNIILDASVENIELLLKKNLISDENKYQVILKLTKNLGELPERNDKLLKILDYITDEHIQKRHKESFGSINPLINNLGRNGSFGSLLQQPLFLKYIEKLKVNDALVFLLKDCILLCTQNNFNIILENLLKKENIDHEEVGKLLKETNLINIILNASIENIRLLFEKKLITVEKIKNILDDKNILKEDFTKIILKIYPDVIAGKLEIFKKYFDTDDRKDKLLQIINKEFSNIESEEHNVILVKICNDIVDIIQKKEPTSFLRAIFNKIMGKKETAFFNNKFKLDLVKSLINKDVLFHYTQNETKIINTKINLILSSLDPKEDCDINGFIEEITRNNGARDYTKLPRFSEENIQLLLKKKLIRKEILFKYDLQNYFQCANNDNKKDNEQEPEFKLRGRTRSKTITLLTKEMATTTDDQKKLRCFNLFNELVRDAVRDYFEKYQKVGQERTIWSIIKSILPDIREESKKKTKEAKQAKQDLRDIFAFFDELQYSKNGFSVTKNLEDSGYEFVNDHVMKIYKDIFDIAKCRLNRGTKTEKQAFDKSPIYKKVIAVDDVISLMTEISKLGIDGYNKDSKGIEDLLKQYNYQKPENTKGLVMKFLRIPYYLSYIIPPFHKWLYKKEDTLDALESKLKEYADKVKNNNKIKKKLNPLPESKEKEKEEKTSTITENIAKAVNALKLLLSGSSGQSENKDPDEKREAAFNALYDKASQARGDTPPL